MCFNVFIVGGSAKHPALFKNISQRQKVKMIQTVLKKMLAGQNLTPDEMHQAMRVLMTGKADDAQIAGFLTALSMKGETVNEIQAAAEIMRELSTKVPVMTCDKLVDPVGTGGTHSNIFNVSTASSIVAACAGVRIAKHGSSAASSQSGSADLLKAAGVNIALNAQQMAQSIETFGMGFMFAPRLHSAMRHVMEVRKALGIRTIFNLLGPLTNPSGAKCQVLGIFDKQWLRPLVEVSKGLGQHRVMALHSDDGLDEISIAASTTVIELRDNSIKEYRLHPQDYGICYNNIDALRVNSAAESLALILSAFSGKAGPAFDIIVLNSAAIIYVAGLTDSFAMAVSSAREILYSGQAKDKLRAYADFTQSLH